MCKIPGKVLSLKIVANKIKEYLREKWVVIDVAVGKEDNEIIALYWNREEAAIRETALKYGAYCYRIAHNILDNAEDSEECVSGTWWHAWNSIPPQKPNILRLFLGKITRNLAINEYKRQRTAKRGGNEMPLILDELSECVSGIETPETELDRKELVKGMNDFLATLTLEKRGIFLRRYWYGDKVADIATAYQLSENNVSVQLSRMRAGLRTFLEERGIVI